MKLVIPFDNPDTGARYEIDVRVNDLDSGDGVVLAVNREACLAFSQLLQQLANQEEDAAHLHLGYTEEVPQGPGWRIVLTGNGRIPSM